MGSVKVIGEAAFASYGSLKEVFLSDEVTVLGTHAFSSAAFRSLDVGDGVKEIGENCFAYCTDLEELRLGTSLQSIGRNVFWGHKDYRDKPLSIIFANSYQYKTALFSEIEEVFIYRQNNNTLTLERYIGNERNISIPQTVCNLPVTEIGEYAFNSVSGLRSIKLPDTIKKISPYAFYNCDGSVIFSRLLQP